MIYLVFISHITVTTAANNRKGVCQCNINSETFQTNWKKTEAIWNRNFDTTVSHNLLLFVFWFIQQCFVNWIASNGRMTLCMMKGRDVKEKWSWPVSRWSYHMPGGT